MTRARTAAASGVSRRAAPVPAQHLVELAWHLFDEAGEDVLLPCEHITDRIHATDGRFERTKGSPPACPCRLRARACEIDLPCSANGARRAAWLAHLPGRQHLQSG